MHIHKPKAPGGVREFIAELGVIVLGILIAIGLEQLVAWNHGQHDLAKAREALRAELSQVAGSLQGIDAQDACIDARLNLLQAWGRGEARIDSTRLASMANRPLLYTLPTTAWDVAKPTIAAQMPLEERLRYADVYDAVDNEKGHVLDERRAWDLLARYAGKRTLTPDEARGLQADLGSVRVRDDDRRFNAPAILDEIASLGVKPGRPPVNRDPRSLCGPPE